MNLPEQVRELEWAAALIERVGRALRNVKSLLANLHSSAGVAHVFVNGREVVENYERVSVLVAKQVAVVVQHLGQYRQGRLVAIVQVESPAELV